MGILAVFSAAHETFCRARLARTDPTPPQPPGRPAMCRRCGCDTPTCREWGCLPQGEPMTGESLAGRGDAYLYQTHYERGMRR